MLSDCDQIPADVLTFFHRHHRPGAVDVAIDGGAEVLRGKAGSEEREHSIAVDGLAFILVHALRIRGERLDVVVEVPAHVLVEDQEKTDKFTVHILGAAIGAGHASRGNDDRPDQAAGYVALLVNVRVIEPHD